MDSNNYSPAHFTGNNLHLMAAADNSQSNLRINQAFANLQPGSSQLTAGMTPIPTMIGAPSPGIYFAATQEMNNYPSEYYQVHQQPSQPNQSRPRVLFNIHSIFYRD